MKATGELYLSRLKPSVTVAAGGVFVLSMQAYDPVKDHDKQPWRLLWSGPVAKAFWQQYRAKLLPGAVLDVHVGQIRLVASTGRHCGPEIVASVKSIYMPAVAANLGRSHQAHQPAPEPITCSADAR